ncbi:hypothetical protein [Desulfosporosinus shakirovi]|uniref:hypothetical protein n=1 Tax=Desulfosporosinus shakirovi TaxID=2885154 RepID=UPI001E56A051|nr:hypothetical protein [Desulfosporosinus sp. SRJS8]MCB8817392.1 hypothetical protein [Desulfosporosinus sp. SRJS8]
MREISPAVNYSVEEFFEQLSLSDRKPITKIREEKRKGLRPLPSEKLIDSSTVLNSDFRRALLNKVAMYVDENLAGRSEMCIQFASLLSLSLRSLGIQSREAFGKSYYYQNGKEVFVWEHAWVRIGKEVIDGNVDILYENPMFPSSIVVSPYWGVINQVPNDRKLVENKSKIYPEDEDVKNIWWPELQQWLINNT